MKRKDTDKLNTKAIAESGELEMYSRDFFVKAGSKGGKKYWALLNEDQRKERIKKLSTGLKKKRLLNQTPSDKIKE